MISRSHGSQDSAAMMKARKKHIAIMREDEKAQALASTEDFGAVSHKAKIESRMERYKQHNVTMYS
eukprot:6466158-Amphidinium_carterae.1